MRFGPLTKVREIPMDLATKSEALPALVDEPMPNAIDLGWHYAGDQHELQMAKVRASDLATHMYVIGASGSGKTRLLEFLIQQDLVAGRGFAVIDPHGDLAEDVKGFFAYLHRDDERALRERAVVIDPTDPSYTAVFNPLERQHGVSSAELAGELLSAFSRIWASAWGVRMEDLMRHSLIALAEADRTLADLPAFLTSSEERRSILATVDHPRAIEYFKRFDALTERARLTWVEPVLNKVNALLADERVRAFFAGTKSTFHLRGLMDEGKVLIVKLDRGRLHDSADLLGSLLMAKLKMAAFSRSDVPSSRRTPFTLYVDEFQNYASDSFGTILSEARKYGLQLVMAHQTLAQVSRELRSVILGNAGLQVFFRVGRSDAELLAKEAFELPLPTGRRRVSTGGWERYVQELQTLAPRCCWVKHKVEGGILSLTTAQIEPPHELFEMGEEACGAYLASLPIGRAYLVERASLAPRALEAFRVAQAPSDDETPPADPLGAVSEPPISAPVEQTPAPAPTPLQERELVAYLRDVAEHPFAPALERDERLSLSRYKGVQARRHLTELGLVRIHRVPTGTRSGQLALLELTAAGEEQLSVEGLRVRHPRGRGGFLHRYYAHKLAEYAQRTWPNATVELERKHGSSDRYPDVTVLAPAENESEGVRSIAFEVFMTGEAKELRGLAKDLDLFDQVFLCTESAEAAASLEQKARATISAQSLERVTFTPINPFLAPSTTTSAPTKKPRSASKPKHTTPSTKHAAKPEPERATSRRSRPQTALLRQVAQAYGHLHDLDWLQESPLVELEAVRERVNPLAPMPEAQALRGLLVDAAKRAAQHAGEVPARAPLRVFLERYLEGARISEIAEELGVSREWCSKAYRKQALELAGMQFVRLTSP